VVAAVTHAADVITSIGLRFEQRCDGNPSALHGQIHWTAP